MQQAQTPERKTITQVYQTIEQDLTLSVIIPCYNEVSTP